MPAFLNKWVEMVFIVKEDPNSVRIPLTESGDTALHVAAGAGSTTCVEELAKLMSPEDVLIKKLRWDASSSLGCFIFPSQNCATSMLSASARQNGLRGY